MPPHQLSFRKGLAILPKAALRFQILLPQPLNSLGLQVQDTTMGLERTQPELPIWSQPIEYSVLSAQNTTAEPRSQPLSNHWQIQLFQPLSCIKALSTAYHFYHTSTLVQTTVITCLAPTFASMFCSPHIVQSDPSKM